MIYTITFNPALDYILSVPEFKIGYTNRTKEEILLPGGKGINVSMVLQNLGVDNVALGFVAGFTGDEICHRLEQTGCHTDFIHLKEGQSRINVKFKEMNGTEVNATGPDIDKESLNALFDRLEQLSKGDILILAGSIPASLPGTIYYDICKMLAGRGVLLVVDATGDLLKNVLPLKPFLIKPNHHELGELFGVEIKTMEEVEFYGKKLQEMGAENVLVSMAADGAVLIAGDKVVYKKAAPDGKVVNAVGAGDSMVAGFLAGWINSNDYEEALKMGLAAGSASAFSMFLATGEEIAAVRGQMD